MKNSLLPVGSVVRVNGTDLVICAYISKGKIINNEQYDYACGLYPFGMGDDAILLKKDQIERVIFIGYIDKRFEDFKKENGD